MDSNPMDIDTGRGASQPGLNEQHQVPTDHKGQRSKDPPFRGRRGKKAQNTRQEQFRTRKNKETMKRYDAERDKRLFGDSVWDDLVPLFESMSVSAQPEAVQLPVTTRGIGFISQEVYNVVLTMDSASVEQSRIDPCVIYRINLSLFSIQLNFSDQLGIGMMIDAERFPREDEVLDPTFVTHFTSVGTNFAVLSNVIETVGSFEYDHAHFKCYVPRTSEIEYVADVRNRKRRKTFTVGFVPNPFLVTIQNLRETVRSLADPATPEEDRSRFEMFSPLPGAVWEDHTLMNPDAICPEGYYEQPQLWRDDLAKFSAFISRAGKRGKRLLRARKLDGKGERCALVTHCVVQNERMKIADGELKFSNRQTYRSIRTLQQGDFLIGLTTLVGERPPAKYRTPLGFGIREPTCQVQVMDADWRSLIAAALVHREPP